MQIKLLNILGLILFLDVAPLPGSCNKQPTYNKDNVIFDTCSQVEENLLLGGIYHYKEPNYRAEIGFTINLPNNIETSSDGYVITSWDLFKDGEKTPISFPYTIKEDDFMGYYCGYRNCVVFCANWTLQ